MSEVEVNTSSMKPANGRGVVQRQSAKVEFAPPVSSNAGSSAKPEPEPPKRRKRKPKAKPEPEPALPYEPTDEDLKALGRLTWLAHDAEMSLEEYVTSCRAMVVLYDKIFGA